jgi:nucleoside-diphosphate-sugar epimerase
MKENFLVTGGSGYVGKILLKSLLDDSRVDKVVVIDKDNLKEEFINNPKVFFIHRNLVEDWEKDLVELEDDKNFKISKVVHLAWQIRTMYGKKNLQNHWNIDGSQRVFEYVKNNPSVTTFVHYSTVASYGAFKENSFDKIFTEEDSFRFTDYLYAEEKRIVEEHLDKLFLPNNQGGSGVGKNIFVIRPASITGPVGRERTGFGLQSALSGKMGKENLLFKVISKILQFMPATHGWSRQFVHEEDIVNATLVMSFSTRVYPRVEKYNLCPTVKSNLKNYIDAEEMGKLLSKKVFYLHPQLVRLLCFLAWHSTLGKVPTSSGVWKAYSYPINVDGSKVEKDFPEFRYKKDVREAYLN